MNDTNIETELRIIKERVMKLSLEVQNMKSVLRVFALLTVILAIPAVALLMGIKISWIFG